VLPLIRRLASVAALLLVVVGLCGWLAPGPEEAPTVTVALRPVSRTAEHALVARVQVPAMKARPQVPLVDLSLEVRNRGPLPLDLDVGGKGTELLLELHGPGVVRLSASDVAGVPEPPFLTPGRVRLAPGASYSLPIRHLVGGTRGHLYGLSWTEAGTYTLTARYRVGTAAASTDQGQPAWVLRTFSALPLSLQVRSR
jgi:hypothetical protein